MNELSIGDTLQDEVLRGDRAGLVEAAHVHAPGKGNAEGLGAEDGWGKREPL